MTERESRVGAWWRRWQRGRRERELGASRALDAELTYHMERVASELERTGLSRAQALAEARQRFGDEAHYRRELARLASGTRWRRGLQTWLAACGSGLRSSARSLRRAPGLAAGIVLTYALGIGANATVFGIVDRLLLSPPAHVSAAEEVRRLLVERDAGGGDASSGGQASRRVVGGAVTMADYEDLLAGTRFRGLAAYSEDRMAVTLGRGVSAERLPAKLVTASFWDVLGVQPQVGRFFGVDEDVAGVAGVAVISHELWQRTFGGDAAVIGRAIDLGDSPYTIIGVTPRGFTGVELAPVDLWLPARTAGAEVYGEMALGGRNFYWLSILGRLRPDTRVAVAEEEATALHRVGRAESISRGYDPGVRIVTASLIAAEGPNRPAEVNVALLLALVSALVLGVACINIANLLLARGIRTRRETGIRMALGITRGRLAAEVLLEGVLLGVLGGAVALLIAHWGGAFVRATLLPQVAFPSPVGLRTVTLTAGLALLAGIASVLLPLREAMRHNASDTLRASQGAISLSTSRSRAVLTLVQAALSVVLLAGAGLFVRSLQQARSIDLGFEASGVVIARPVIAGSGLDDAAVARLYDDAVRTLGAEPGIIAAAAAANLPFASSSAIRLGLPGRSSLPELPGGGPYIHAVTAGYFTAMDLRLLRGRGIASMDVAGAPPVAVVNRTMAELLWPGEDALGQCMLVGDRVASCTTVIGILEDAHRQDIFEQAEAQYYVALAQGHMEMGPSWLIVRAADAAALPIGRVRDRLLALEPRLPFVSVFPMHQLIDPQLRSWTLGATLFSLFGVLALLVAASGLHALLAFDVSQSGREIGLRAALGAGRPRLLAMVLLRALRLTATGVVLGTLFVWFFAPRLAGMLYAVSPRDPLTLIVVAVTLLLTAIVASWPPAWRALRVDPNLALRAD